MTNLLTRRFDLSTDNHLQLTQGQQGLDAALNSFSQTAADPASLAAMTVGSFAFRFARLGFLQGAASSGITRFAPRFLLNGAVNLSALGVEVTAFRQANNVFGSWAGHHPEQGVFDVNGWRGTFVDFLALKTIGHLGAGQNIALTHFAQANAMVLGHEASARLGFTPHEEGSYIERLAHAEVTNMAMGAGMSLAGVLTGGATHRIERGIDLRIESLRSSHLSSTFQPLTSGHLESLIPSMARNTSLSSSHSLSHEYSPRPLGALQGKVLVVANRGEASLRAATTAQRLGLKTVVLASDADKDSWHANLPGAIRDDIGGTKIMESYGNIPKLREVLQRVARDLNVKAEDIILWPGWGGAAEDPNLARMVSDANARFAGPSAFAMELLGPKSSSNDVARAAGLQPIPASDRIIYKTESDILQAIKEGTQGLEGDAAESRTREIREEITAQNSRARAQARAEFERIYEQYGHQPVMIKGVETGGGRGIRVVERPENFDKFFDEAVQESRDTSPSADVFIAKYVTRAHHLEAQVMADAYGNIRVLGIRECSLQRNQQKVQERDITALLPSFLRNHIISQATAMMQQVRKRDPQGVGYTNAVTIEFLWDMEGLPVDKPFSGKPEERLFILEANTRLQVEHCVTEEAVRLRREEGKTEKLDFVELQLRIAAGEKINFAQEELVWEYATLQTRINAEDPYNSFLPSPGQLSRLEFPDMEDIRVDRGVETDRIITPHYDSNVAKVMARVEVPADLRERKQIDAEDILAINQKLADRMSTFLGKWEMAGVRSNVPFHRALLATPQVRNGLGYYTKFIEKEFIPSEAGRRSYENWNVALISAAIATYVGRREKVMASLSAGHSIEDLSKIEMEIGGHEFRFEVRESGPGDYFAQVTGQKVEIVGTGRVTSATGAELELRRSRTGKFFISRDGQEMEVIRRDENTFEVRAEGSGEVETFTLQALQIFVTLQGEQVAVAPQSGGGWSGNFRGSPIVLEAAESHQYWAKFPPTPLRVKLARSGPIYDLNVARINYRSLVDSRQGRRYIQLGGVEYDISVAGEGILSKEHVIAPLPGKIVTPPALMPKVGDLVEEGQEVLTEEAMKQKTAIRARMSGKIVAIHAKSGDLVAPNESLVVIGPVNEEISPRRDTLPVAEALQGDALASAFFPCPPPARGPEAYPETLAEHIGWQRQAVLGFDVPQALVTGGRNVILEYGRTERGRQLLLDILRGLPQKVEKEVEGPDGNKSKVTEIVYVGGLLDAVSSVHLLAHPLHTEAFHHYLNTRDASKLNPALNAALMKALANYGITSLEPSLALDEALYRIHRAHRDGAISNLGIANLIEVIRELEMREMVSALTSFQRSYVGEAGKGQIPLAHLAHEAQSHLESGDRRQAWAVEFNTLFERTLAQEPPIDQFSHGPAMGELIRTPRPAKRFLLKKIGDTDPRVANLATEILFERLYGGREYHGGKHETYQFEPSTDASLALGTFRDHDTREMRSVVFVRASSLEELPAIIERAKSRLRACRSRNNVIEISVPQALLNNTFDDAALEAAIQRAVADLPHLKRVTLAIARQKAGNGPDAPAYRTYRPMGPRGEFIRHRLFDDIHPMDAWKIFELDRWIRNFVPERIPDVLLPDIYAFRVQDGASRAVGSKDPRKEGDLRNLVVAQVTGDLQYKRFGAALESQLMELYTRLQKNPQAPLTEEEEIALRAIPWGLKLAGRLARDFNPFTMDTMQGPVRQIISEFLGEPGEAIPLLRAAAHALEGKVYSVPEAERQAINAALTLSRVQATTPGGPLDARIDLYIHAPLEASRDELAFTVGRVLNHFSDPRIEKTAIRFHRAEEGEYREYVSSVRTPAGTRIEIAEEPITERSPHEIRSSLVKKQQAALAKGSLYVYDRVHLLEEAIREIWPHELSLPEDPVRLQEYHLRNNRLQEVDREPGRNRSGMVVYEATMKFPKDLRGGTYERKMMWVGNDASIDGGGLGPTEARIYEAAFERAMELGIPIHYASDSSGAAMAGPFSNFAGQVFRSLRKTWNNEQQRWVLWATTEQLESPIGPPGKQKSLRQLVTAEKAITVDDVEGFEVTDISGEIFLSTESLKGSAQTARVTALANKKIPVFGSAHGVTIGIGTYDWVLSVLNMIPVETSAENPDLVLAEAAAALTGPRAVKETGLGDVRSAQDYAGARRLAAAGIASQLPVGEMGVAENMLRMLALLPSHRGEEAPRVETGDPKNRDVGSVLATIIPGRGRPFNMRQVINTLFDQGPLSGVFELWKNYGPTALVGFARLNGRTVAYVFPQPQPDAVGAGRGPFFGSTLDSESAFKVAMMIRTANRLGIPLVMDPAFAGFMPDAINVSRRVYEGGAEIVRALEEFDGPIVQYLHPYAEWWGGCVAVSEKSINTGGNIVTLADTTAQAGILGAAGAMSVPKVFRVRDENFNQDPRVIELRKRLGKASATEKDEIERQLQAIFIEITNQVKDYYMLVNSAARAQEHGSIDRIIAAEELGQTRRILIDTFEAAITQYRNRTTEEAAQSAALHTLQGAFTFARMLLPDVPSSIEVRGNTVKLCVGMLCLRGRPTDVLSQLTHSIRMMVPNLADLIPDGLKIPPPSEEEEE